MSEISGPKTQLNPECTEDALDRGLAAAYGRDSALPLASEKCVLSVSLTAYSSVPRILLRDPDEETITGVVLPGSTEMPPGNVLPGTAGTYQLLGEMARGGMGAILKGRDAKLGRDIAVKVLLETHAGQTELVQRFVEEAQITGQLQHPGIVPIYELGAFPDERPYFTMKLVKGKTLAALLKERKSTSDDRSQFLAIFEQVCQTLAYAHARAVIHRDLKPSNIMVGAFGEVQVMDWGLAKVLAEGGIADEKKAQPAMQVSIIRTQRSAGSSASDNGSHTQAGSMLGTPSYVAPEQARGDIDLIDERDDVFGLGAILCEILTREPPFTGKGAEAVRKAQTASLAEAYSRLETCGADADLVALARRCLEAEPWNRLRNASEVAASMTNYQQSVLQRLRQSELDRAAAEVRVVEEARTRKMAEGRALEERRRRRITMAFAAAVISFPVLGGGGAAWWWQERSQMVGDVEAALADATRHRSAGRWPQARAALERATGRLGSAKLPEMRKRIQQAQADDEVVATFEEIRLSGSEIIKNGDGNWSDDRTDARYNAALRKYGIDITALSTEEAAARVRNSDVREPLLAALNGWISVKPSADRASLRNVADAADDNPWRRSLCAAIQTADGKAISELLQQPEAIEQAPAVLSWLRSSTLKEWGVEDERIATYLTQSQRRYPGDFWINLRLGTYLGFVANPARWDESLSYFRVAVGIRPDSMSAHGCLGIALSVGKQLDQAIAELRLALELEPNPSAMFIGQLGATLAEKGEFDAAMNEYRKALELDPQNEWCYTGIGYVLSEKKDFEGAIAAYRQAITIDPKMADAHSNLGACLSTSDPNAALDECRQGVSLAPQSSTSHRLLAAVLSYQNDLEGAAAEYRAAVALNPLDLIAQKDLCSVLLLQNDLDAALMQIPVALTFEPDSARLHTDLGDVLQRKKEWKAAAVELRRSLDLDPSSVRCHILLGDVLVAQEDDIGAAAEFDRALELDSNDGAIYSRRAELLLRKNDVNGALAEFRRAVELAPQVEWIHYRFGMALRTMGLDDTAIDEFRESMYLNPDGWGSRTELVKILGPRGRLEEVFNIWQQAIEQNPPLHASWYGFAELCLFLGHEDAYRLHRPKLLKQFRGTLDPMIAERTARACLLMPAEGEELNQAVALAERAVAAGPQNGYYGYFLVAKGLAEYRLGHYENAVRLTTEAATRGSRFANLYLIQAMATQRLEKPDEAQSILNRVIQDNGWIDTTVDYPTPWIAHIFRREAELLIFPNFGAFPEGKYEPQENSERLKFFERLYFRHAYRAAARLATDAFSADPSLMDKWQEFHRYNAACAASLASSGQGTDMTGVDELERTRLRQQALLWLRAELDGYKHRIASATGDDATAFRQQLEGWLKDNDLSAVRDELALATLPEDEKQSWITLWTEVKVVIAKERKSD